MNIKELLEQNHFSCRKMGNHDGGVYGSSCPWCGGEDRFRCWPHGDNGGNYYCQQCGRKGGVVRYLADFRSMNYTNACNLLGIKPGFRRLNLREKFKRISDQQQLKETDPIPPSLWQTRASSLIQIASDKLWNEGSDIRNWLHSRGLNDETIKTFNLGWIAADFWTKREDWGLPTKIKDNGQSKKLWIPAGLVIPYIANDSILRIRIRRFQNTDDLKYYLVAGSSNIPAIFGKSSSIVIVESDLDAFLVSQEAGDLVTAVALGSAQIRPDRQLTDFLNKADILLIALDTDKAGSGSYWKWWKKHFPLSKRWPPISGKDPTEAYQNGLDIRGWILAGLSVSSQSKSNNAVQNNSW